MMPALTGADPSQGGFTYAHVARARPPVSVAGFWGRGERDAVIPQQAIARTQSRMAAHTSPESVVYSGLRHDVAGREVTDFTAFLAQQVGR
jgi:phospholipase/carboxylesterase